jgi:hypothetical protein
MNRRVPAVWLAFVLALVLGISIVPNPAVVASPRQGAGGRGAAPPAQPPQTGRQNDPTKAATPSGQRQFTPTGPTEVNWEWWNDADAKKMLNLDERKAKEIDAIYDRRQRLLKPYVDEFLKRREALDKMSRERVVDRDTYAVAVTTYESLRGELAKSRSVMVYEIFLKLSPEQYQKLLELFESRRARMGRGGAPQPK